MDAQYRHMVAERAGIGATGHITQATRLNFTSLTTTLPMVIVVRRGRKVIQAPNYAFELEAGEAIAIAQGQVFDFENIPAPDGDYEARWLAGWLAGRQSQAGVAGYVAGFPVPEVVQGINAFTLGMRAANPKAEVRVVWLNAWFDPPRERDAAMSLFNQDVDVIAFHTGSTAVMAAAQERGKMAVAYHSDMRKAGPDAQIVAVTHQWGAYYTQRARAALDGSWKSGNVWGGVKEGMIRVGEFGARVPKAVQDEVLARQRDIASGKLHPFTGPIADNEGKAVLPAGAHMTDAQILSMNFLVSGVQGKASK